MLFIQIDVKIYVPDGFGDFMDALSDPRAFASAQEKRAEQLKSLGIEESEIGTNVIESKGKKPAGGGKPGAGQRIRRKGIVVNVLPFHSINTNNSNYRVSQKKVSLRF